MGHAEEIGGITSQLGPLSSVKVRLYSPITAKLDLGTFGGASRTITGRTTQSRRREEQVIRKDISRGPQDDIVVLFHEHPSQWVPYCVGLMVQAVSRLG